MTGNSEMVIFKFRLELIERLLQDGFEVYTAFPKTIFGDGETVAEKYGCHYYELFMDAHGTNPIAELRLIGQYRKLLCEIRPDIIFTFTIKPNIYCSLAAGALGIPCVLNVSGLGIAVENPGPLQHITSLLYKAATRKVQCVFFQNKVNEQFFAKRNIAEGKRKILPGSGVNLSKNQLELYPAERNDIHFLFAGRIMKDKGISELLEAARLIKSEFPSTEITVLGSCEAQYEAQMQDANSAGIVHYLGHQDGIHEYIKDSDCMILPSYHEGMANVLLEAAATGRPIIASKVAGCVETFDEGVSGFGCEPRNPADLAAVMKKFILLPYGEKVSMGLAGRKKVEAEFDRNIVVNAYIDEIERLNTSHAV